MAEETKAHVNAEVTLMCRVLQTSHTYCPFWIRGQFEDVVPAYLNHWYEEHMKK